MTLQVTSRLFCLPLQKQCIVANYGGPTYSWENLHLTQCVEDTNSCNNLSIECCSFSPCEKYLAVCFNKDLLIYSTSNWKIIASVRTERKGISVKFFPKDNIILLAEKSGNIKFFKFGDQQLEKIDLILGHNSMVIDALVTDDEKYIITCDRDEKIRVTNFPNIYNIQCYCLGHTQFVCSINLLKSDKNVLISSSGDGTIRFWEIQTGKELIKYKKDNSDSKLCSTNPSFFTKITLNELDSGECLIAALEYKSLCTTILKVDGTAKDGLKISLFYEVKYPATHFDLEFWHLNIIILVEDKIHPFIMYNCQDNFTEKSSQLQKMSSLITEHWDSILTVYKTRNDTWPLRFQYRKDDEPHHHISKKMK